MHFKKFLILISGLINVHGLPAVHQVNISQVSNKHMERETLKPGQVEVDRILYDSCTQEQISVLRPTVITAFQITKQMTTAFTKDNPYVKAFWPADSFSDAWMTYGQRYYFLMATKTRVDNEGYSRPTFHCTTCDDPGWVAYTVAETNTISFCPNFFSDFKDVKDLPCNDGKPLGQYDGRGCISLSLCILFVQRALG